MSFTDLHHYKHDITGKFRDLTSAVSLLTDESLKDPESVEVLHAIHEVILRMMATSKKTISGIGTGIELVVSPAKPKTEQPLLPLDGIQIRLEGSGSLIRYWLYLSENQGDSSLLIARAQACLPFSVLRNENELSQK